LAARGLGRVAVIKHSHHLFADVPGKDTDRLRKAGAAAVGLLAADAGLLCYRSEQEEGPEGLLSLLATLGPFDLVLLEGFKSRPGPKIEVVRRAVNPQLISPPEELLAVVGDVPPPAGVRWIRYGEEDSLAEIVLDWLERRKGGRR